VLAISIRSDSNVHGFKKIGYQEIKINIFADDLTAFLRDRNSLFSIKKVLNVFGALSGLKMNHDKTEAMWLGTPDLRKRIKEDIQMKKIDEPIKKTLNVWKWRNLTLLGRIQIIKILQLRNFFIVFQS